MTRTRLIGLPLAAGIVFWLLWLLVAERYLFRPDLATTILGVSLTVNVVLLGVLVQRRP